MPTAKLSLRAKKSQAYFDSLCKHFARKVEVVRDGNVATVAFPMGTCEMRVCEEEMLFRAETGDEASLEGVKRIIDTHVARFSEFRKVVPAWQLDDPTHDEQP